MSHAGEYATAAVCSLPVGIDIEQKWNCTDALAKRICTAEEYETVWKRDPTDACFRDLFSAKESCVKRTGRGLQDIASVDTLHTPCIRQIHFEPYVLSVCTDYMGEWEAEECKNE